MRRAAAGDRKAGHERVAVVCGAWHAPALAGPLPPAAADNAHAQRAGPPQGVADLGAVDPLPARQRVRLRRRRHVPGLVPPPVRPPPTSRDPLAHRRSPRVLRSRDLPVSTRARDRGGPARRSPRRAARPAARRSGRGRPRPPGRCSARATRSPPRYVTDHLVVGERLGAVPDDVPTVPLRGRPRPAPAAPCGSSGRRPPATSTSTCASRTT